MANYKVIIDGASKNERVSHGVFETAAEAVEACKGIADDFLRTAFKPGMTATALAELYERFGGHPAVVPVDPEAAPVAFPAADFVKARCKVIAATKGLIFPYDWDDVTDQYVGTTISVIGAKPPKAKST